MVVIGLYGSVSTKKRSLCWGCGMWQKWLWFSCSAIIVGRTSPKVSFVLYSKQDLSLFYIGIDRKSIVKVFVIFFFAGYRRGINAILFSFVNLICDFTRDTHASHTIKRSYACSDAKLYLSTWKLHTFKASCLCLQWNKEEYSEFSFIWPEHFSLAILKL